MHHQRWRRHGDLDWYRPHHSCSVKDCDRGAHGNGMCLMHYKRWRKYGDPSVLKKTPNGEPLKWLLAHVDFDGPDCLIWPFGRTTAGYGIMGDGAGDRYAHREMCRLTHGEPPPGLRVAKHDCGNGHLGCVHPKHIDWGTHAENTNDMWRHGTMVAGTKHPGAKLTEEDVRAIRDMAKTVTELQIADRFGISPGHTHRIISRQRWAWLG